jgi:hypothetical protein
MAIIPYTGIQNDEALFAGPLNQHINRDFRARLFHHDIPLMVMSYIGTLKTLLYWPIFAWLGASVWTTRLPMVFAGAITIFLFFRLAIRAAGPYAALLAVLILATDPMFLLTNTVDWGPVAVEHLLLVTGTLMLVRFAQRTVSGDSLPSNRDLWLGCFCLGLALWNKAIFLWALSGLTVAGLSVFWREIRAVTNRRRAFVAISAFAIGALPFLIYNLRHFNATLRGNAVLSTAEMSGKYLQLRHTLDGQALLGFMAAEENAERPKALTSRRGRAALWIREHFGEHRADAMVYACAVLLLAVPLWWQSRAARFSVLFCVVTWAAMAFTRDAGGAAHHAVLLWPFPHLFVGATLAGIRWRWFSGLAVAFLIAMNLLVVNQYILQFERDGADATFTDALLTLSEQIAEKPGQSIYVLDWGMQNGLDLLHRGRLMLYGANDPYMSDSPPTIQDLNYISRMLQDPDALFLGHVPEREIFPGVGRRAEAAATARGYHKELLQTVADSNGRPVFEVFRFVR